VTHKLLLADDSVTIQRVVELTFSGEDVDVVTVGDGEQAIARIPVELPDIVLADIGMPKRSGYDVAAFVKGRSDLSHIPVLLLAGAFEPVDETRAQQVHSDGVLVKPFEPQHVISRVRDLIETSRSASSRPSATVIPETASTVQPAPSVQARTSSASDAEAAAVTASSDRNVDSKLDDYFDRLDAAFLELGSDANKHSSTASGLDDLDGRDVPTLESLLAVSASARTDQSPAGAPPMPVELNEYEPVPQQAPVSRISSAVQESLEPTEPRNLVADMFAALFAAEQGESVEPAPSFTPPRPESPAVVTDNLVDEVTRRVLARLAPDAADDLVVQIVSEVAERLIREEINRIKAAAAARL
jgi:DNA-binding response OmpR family regulator